MFDGIELFDLVPIFLATWAITYGIVSGTVQGAMLNQKQLSAWKPSEDNTKPPAPVFANSFYGETDGKLGPFGLYKTIRRILGTSSSETLNEASYCRVCISFSIGLVFATIASINHPIADIVLYGVAAHGAVITYGTWVKVQTHEGGQTGWKINDF